MKTRKIHNPVFFLSATNLIALTLTCVLLASCSISNVIPRRINIPILTAIQATGMGHTISATLHNVEAGFIGYRLVQDSNTPPDSFVPSTTCPSDRNICNATCCDCTNLQISPATSGTFVMEIFNSQTLMGSGSSEICAFATTLQSGFLMGIFAIVRNTNSTLSFSGRSNVLRVP